MWVRKEEGRRKASGFLLLSRPHLLGWSSLLWLISGAKLSGEEHTQSPLHSLPAPLLPPTHTCHQSI